ncbi:MAG: metal ABC transporter permease [Bacillota bacterium]
MEIFDYGFMRNAFFTGALIGVVCPVVGLFVTLKRLSLIADALSHVCLAGVAAGLLTGSHPVVTASVFSVSGAFLIEALRARYSSYPELAIAVILSTGAAGGAVLLGLGKGLNANFMSYLFGSIITVSGNDVAVIAASAAFILVMVKLFYKELFFVSFDEEGAAVAGLPVRLISVGFTAMTALAIAVSIKIVGILLVSSLMVLPVAAALKLAKSFRGALLLSALLGELAVLLGLAASFYLNLAPGGVIIMVSVAILILSVLFGPLRPASGRSTPISS